MGGEGHVVIFTLFVSTRIETPLPVRVLPATNLAMAVLLHVVQDQLLVFSTTLPTYSLHITLWRPTTVIQKIQEVI